MKHTLFYILSILLLAFTTGCNEDKFSIQEEEEETVILSHLYNTWVMSHYDTTTQMNTGDRVTTTRLNEEFALTLYDDGLFTLASDGELLAEGSYSLDADNHRLLLGDYELYPDVKLEGIGLLLIPLITSKTLQIDALDANSLQLTMPYSENTTLTAYMKRREKEKEK